jgi:hypothetical protein
MGEGSQQPDARAKYREHLVDARQKAQGDFDKTMVLLAGGALALSLTFVHDIVGAHKPRAPWILMIGWVALVLSLLAILASFCASRFALEQAIRAHDNACDRPHLGCMVFVTEALNVLSGAFFMMGIVCVTVFACINVGGHQ